MYKLVLILKYLRRKLAPMFAALAVTLCTAMVIIVISVMGGFLELLRDSARQLTGDVIVASGSLTGFPSYEEMLAEIEALPEVDAATPVVRGYGLINISDMRGREVTKPVEIEGIDPTAYQRVVNYRDTLHWADPQHEGDRDGLVGADSLNVPAYLSDPDATVDRAGLVMGIHVNPDHRRDSEGKYNPAFAAIGRGVTLTVVPVTQRGELEQQPRYGHFTVINEFKSGLYDVDANRVYVPFEALQRLLRMEAREGWEQWDPETGEPVGEPSVRPGRATELVLRAAPGFTLEQVRVAVDNVVGPYWHRDVNMPTLYTMTWQQKHGDLIAAVQNERGLVTFLFVIISLVAVVMVATTFYMIVLEKTRDIGVLRAIGASGRGIMAMFLGYGLAIGVVGALAGMALAYLIVTNLNDLQFALAERLGTFVLWGIAIVLVGILGTIAGALLGRRRDTSFEYALGGLLVAGLGTFALSIFAFELLAVGPIVEFNATYGWRMWDPSLYFFDRIPDEVDPVSAAAIVLGAIVSSVAGALVPAVLAARQNPIEALRYE